MDKFIVAEKVAGIITECTGKACKVEPVIKNNNTRYAGISVGFNTDGIPCPTFNIDDGIAGRVINDMDISDIASSILKTMENMTLPLIDSDIINDILCNKDKVLERAFIKLVNSKWNDGQNFALYKINDDLAAMLCIDVLDICGGCINLKYEHLDRYGLSKDDLYKAGIKNLKGKGVIENIGTFIARISGMPVFEVPDTYVISNREMFYGASVILDKDVQDEVSRLYEGDYLLIPSSVHETIAMPANVISNNDVVAFIQQVNGSELTDAEKLSDHPYMIRNGKLVAA